MVGILVEGFDSWRETKLDEIGTEAKMDEF